MVTRDDFLTKIRHWEVFNKRDYLSVVMNQTTLDRIAFLMNWVPRDMRVRETDEFPGAFYPVMLAAPTKEQLKEFQAIAWEG